MFLFFLTFSSLNSFSQAYYPDGKKITIKYGSIKSLLDTLGINESTSYDYKQWCSVYFMRLTNKPIFVFFWKNPTPLKIKEIISTYNYNKYLYSYSYYWDLKDMIKKGSLTKQYLLEIFQEPDAKGTSDEESEYWIFKKYNSKILFENDTAKSADVINYNAFKKNELTISSFEVTGSDYSIGFNISLLNLSSKVIKYVSITVTATNSVNDKVGTQTVKGVGPIKFNEPSNFEFKDIINSGVAKYLTIENIKIEYMDGTIKLIPKSEVHNIKIQNWEEVGTRTIDD